MNILLDMNTMARSNRYINGKTFKKNITISSEINNADFLKNAIKYGKKLRN